MPDHNLHNHQSTLTRKLGEVMWRAPGEIVLELTAAHRVQESGPLNQHQESQDALFDKTRGDSLPMRLISVNVSKPKTVLWQGKEVRTGIFKEPVGGKVKVSRLNLEGDGQADLLVHGGEDKAVYAYPAEHYPAWSAELGRMLSFGQIGENLTLEGMLEDQVRVGDVYRVGSVMLQVSQPRTPCYKLGIKMGDDAFPQRFLESGRSGFYLRVMEEGLLQAGDRVHRESTPADSFTILDVCRLRYFEPPDIPGLRQAAELAALSLSWRRELRRRLARALLDAGP